MCISFFCIGSSFSFERAKGGRERRTVPNLLIGKGFDALILAYERVNQLDLLAANGTFLSQPMVRKAMVVIEDQIREYPRFRLFPRFRNGRFRLLATSLLLLLRTLLNRYVSPQSSSCVEVD